MIPERNSKKYQRYPWPLRRKSQQLDWGADLSVCLASVADRGRSIVVSTDQMISLDSVSLDHTVVKGDFLGVAWFAMWAGDDIAPIPSIISRTKKILVDDGRPKSWSRDEVAAALAQAYQDETLARAVTEYLSPLGIDMPTFLSKGPEIFQSDYATKVQEFYFFDLGLEFLVAGYDNANKPCIFTVGRRGSVRYYDKPGFWVIGSGSAMAYGALALRQHNTLRTTQETIYSVLEAKFSAELSVGVGRHTTAGVLTVNNFIRLLPQDEITAIQQIWRDQGKPPIPNDALIAIQKWWGPHRASMDREQQETLKRVFSKISQAAKPTPKPPTRGRKRPPPSQE